MARRRHRIRQSSVVLGSFVGLGALLSIAGRGDASPRGLPVLADTRSNATPKPLGCTVETSQVIATATVVPDYLLQSIFYIPVGNASSATYGSGSSSGTTTTFTSTSGYSTTTTQSVQQSYTSPTIDDVPIGFTASMTNSQGSGSGYSDQWQTSVAFSTNSTFSKTISSSQDAPDHGKDIFVLWVQPRVTDTITEVTDTPGTKLTADSQCMANTGAKSTSHQVSKVTMSGGGIDFFTADMLLGYDTIETDTPTGQTWANAFAKLTAQDRTQVLALDPFVAGTAMNTQRFVILATQPPGTPSIQPGSGSAVNITNTTTTSSSGSQTINSNSSAAVQGSIGVKFGTVGVTTTTQTQQQWTWSQTTAHADQHGTSQISGATFGTKTAGYSDNVKVYWDTLYNTFLFRSNNYGDGTPPQQPPQVQGTATSGGKRLANTYVTLKFANGTTMIVRTDDQGHYSVRGAPAGALTASVSGKIVSSSVIAPGKIARANLVL
jgi:hypothetical protein